MIQIQPKYLQKESWHKLAVKETLGFEILEFSSSYVNKPITEDMIRWHQDIGLSWSYHGAFMDNYPISPDLKIRELSRQRCEESCLLAKRVGAANVVFHSTALPFLRGPVLQQWCREAAAYYQELAQKHGLCIYIENFHDVDYEPLAGLMEYVTDPRVKICLDVGHANYSRVPVSAWISALDQQIGYLHLSDNKGLWDDHCTLGEGTVDLAIVNNWWQRQEREIPVTLEIPGLSDLERSIRYLKEHQYFGFTEIK